MSSIIRLHKDAILAIDPNARVGVRGSLASGKKNSGGDWDPNTSDIDGYVAGNRLYERGRYSSEIPELAPIEASINAAIKLALPCLRKGFTFKTQHQNFPENAKRFGEVIAPVFWDQNDFLPPRRTAEVPLLHLRVDR